MLRIKYRGQMDLEHIKTWQKKRHEFNNKIEIQVREIIERVKKEGDKALLGYSRTYDCHHIRISDIKIDSEKTNQALKEVPIEDLKIIEETIERITNFHERQKENSWFFTEKGLIAGQIIRPIKRVGLYVPGGQKGKTPLFSTLIMSAVPAKVAGVKELVVVTPPREDGTVHPYILATAHLLGIEEIYAIGSAWAIAALAFGTESIPRTDMVVGPGNIYVTLAKKILFGEIGIDMLAGPSEVVILADNSANYRWIAADLLSQAEHDPLASSVLITPHEKLIDEVEREINKSLNGLPKKDIALSALNSWGALIHTSDIDTGIEIVNFLAPEHLELCVKDPWLILDEISSAGTIFLGHHTPEPVGDYFAGPNHILPTTGTARFSSGLCVSTFYKRINVLSTTSGFIKIHGHKITKLAKLEGLEAHGRSIEERLKD